ncbi:DUF3800 domain-containing protein [Hansschlegelia zhihuaiae]|uniref:DUF3800 domain-containing protein n=1 Tax=Hansschlegelia zhihuaiae TaxID=405005 RepID=A0A4Q0M5J3_9HYPH|nr:DUF3800 domain-containing protein [Hansschlegelia zhihuaiae]RXF68225.1 DUF3800 domain-containing protein [Hansschlegelia zhihuaiae]
MQPSDPTSDYEYIVFIDEAGDPGLRKVAPISPEGASEWLCLGAIVVQRPNENEVVSWVKEAREKIFMTQRPDIHFNALSPYRKRVVSNLFASKPFDAFVLASNKKNMEGHKNTRAEKVPSKDFFYNWCVRLLLERITDWCERHSLKLHGEPKKVRFIFSERGGHSYSQMRAYLMYLQQQGSNPYLQKRTIKWSVFDWRLVEPIAHRGSAGLQIADTLASSFFQAAHALSPNWTVEYAEAFAPRLAMEKGVVADYGLVLQPTPPRKAQLTPEQQQIFRFYGYRGF